MTSELLNDFAEDTESLPIGGGTMTGDVSLGTNVKAKFGAGDDLQIYHDGSNSYIKDNGTGDLILTSSTAHRVRTDQFQISNNANTVDILQGVPTGAVTAYYAGSPKLATTVGGIGITGEATASVRYLTATGNSNSGYQFTGDGDTGMHSSANNILQFSTGGSERLRITSAGNVGIGTTAPAEKLDVAGSIKASGTFKGSVAAPALFTYRHVGSLSPTPTVFTTRTALQSAGLVSGGVYVFTAAMSAYSTGITSYYLLGVTKPWIFSTDSSNHSSTYTIGDFVWQGHAYHPTVTIHYRFELGTSGANQDFLVSSTGTSTTDFAAGVAGKKLDIYIKRIA
jgi:hypothetical protein